MISHNSLNRRNGSSPFPIGLEDQIPSDILGKVVQTSSNKNYAFTSMDDNWKINLTRTFVALSTKRYERWELFREKLNVPFHALLQAYSPHSFSRIGLRYIDVIKRSELGLSDTPWEQLLQPYIAGVLSAPHVGMAVKDIQSRHDIELADGASIVRISTGFTESANGGELCFVIDSDLSNSTGTSKEDAMGTLDYFNLRASRLIRWCITERLHTAMEPEIV